MPLNDWIKGAVHGMTLPTVHLPYVLFTQHKKLNLDLSELFILVHLLAFRQLKGTMFPTLDELAEHTHMSTEQVAHRLQKLIHQEVIHITEQWDETQNVRYEKYDLSGLFSQLIQLGKEQDVAQPLESEISPIFVEKEQNVFAVFEKEFARPLSPMECETISDWIDKDRYPQSLILMALKEAVFSGKVHFRYIDRILLEWEKNRIKTTEEAKRYTQKFRAGVRL